MRKLLRSVVLLACMICCCNITVNAQQMPTLPVDPNVRIGHLPNGLTYYIRHNDKPEHRVEFHIAQKVGAILEEPQQRGLAHFLEHMAFNGTKNFPGNDKGLGIVPWCEKHGIKFGVNLNAYTGVDETVYRISNVPSTDKAVVDSCLLILHDWSNAILLEDSEIDKERGVIREEWRSRNNGMLRLYTDAQSVMYPDSKYADCMPIGSMDVVNNFPYKDIKDYYKKWYRPDQQGIIIVGDINVDQMEQQLKKVFADVKAPVNPAERIYYPVADNEKPIIYIGKDKEIGKPNFTIYFKQDIFPVELRNTVGYLAQNVIVNLVSNMLNDRLAELTQKANPPFLSASCGYSNYFLSKTKDAFIIAGSSTDAGLLPAMKASMEVVESARKFGFTASEYSRAKANFLKAVETRYNEREKTENDTYVQEYIDNFTDNEPIPGIEKEYQLYNMLLPNIPLEAINQILPQILKLDGKNEVVFIAMPEKKGVVYPSKEQVEELLKSMPEMKVEAYKDEVSDEPLMKEAPKGGKIVSVKKGLAYGTTLLTLSNGVKVYIKPTDFQADEVKMLGESFGGNSLFPDSEVLNFNMLNSVMGVGGVAKFDNVQLGKVLAGKNVNVNFSVGSNMETVGGSCSPKDFETMMQLTYLYFTQPRQDMEAFESFKKRTKASIEAAKSNPLSSIGDTISDMLYGKHPRNIHVTPEMIDKIDYNQIVKMYKERFANAADFTFFFIGNIEEKDIPLIATYLGALPADKSRETFRNNHMDIQKGVREKVYTKELETPMATIFMGYSGECKNDLRNRILMTILSQTMDMVYTEEVREKEGGTYGVTCQGSLVKYPVNSFIFQIVYQTDPAKMEKLNGIIDRELANVVKVGPTQEHLDKVKQYLVKNYADMQKDNGYWMNVLSRYFFENEEVNKEYVNIVNKITVKDVKEFAEKLFNQKNKVTVVLTAEEKK